MDAALRQVGEGAGPGEGRRRRAYDVRGRGGRLATDEGRWPVGLAEPPSPPYGGAETERGRPVPEAPPEVYAGPRVAGRSRPELAGDIRIQTPVEPEELRLSKEERGRLALVVDDLLRKVTRGKDALGLRLGELFQWLDQGDRLITLGYHRLGDYAREECGLTAGDAQAYRRLARALESRPIFRRAVQDGEISAVKVERVKQVAVGETEAAWADVARALTVRALTAMVKAARSVEGGRGGVLGAPVFPDPADSDEPSAAAPEDPAGTAPGESEDPPTEGWTRITVPASPDELRLFDEAVALARGGLGADAPPGRCVEAMAQEVLSEAAPPAAPRPSHGLRKPAGRAGGGTPSELRKQLEEETQQWAFLEQRSPALSDGAPVTRHTEPFSVHEEVVRLSALLRGWDVLACRLSFLMHYYRLWRPLQFGDLDHYATERLGLSGRALGQRAWLERKMFEWPALRAALEDGTLCYARALEVARAEGEIPIAWAASHSVLEIRHRAEEVERGKMLEDSELRVVLPNDAWDTIDAALRAIQHAADRGGTPLDSGQAFWVMVANACLAWRPLAPKKESLRRRLEARKRALCEAYGCTMPGVDMHHVELRSHQGSDEAENRVLLCRPHHQRGAHGPGHTEIVALGGERFEWRFGCRPGHPPLRVVVTGGAPEEDPPPGGDGA